MEKLLREEKIRLFELYSSKEKFFCLLVAAIAYLIKFLFDRTVFSENNFLGFVALIFFLAGLIFFLWADTAIKYNNAVGPTEDKFTRFIAPSVAYITLLRILTKIGLEFSLLFLFVDIIFNIMNKNFPNYSEHMLITAGVIGAFSSLLKTVTKPFYRKVYSLWDENVD
ncbi:MAG: hypothetical protein U2P59_03460 [Synergistota bacterium]|nr:hypothetical protein [Synergistota bacterium]